MRIAIDARFFGPINGGGGIGRYVSELIHSLQKLDHHNEYHLLLTKDSFHECLLTAGNFYKHLVHHSPYTFAGQRELPRLLSQINPRFTHFPHWTVPLTYRKPFLTTLHDVIWLDDPDSRNATTRHPLINGLKRTFFRLSLEKAVHQSRQIITPSNYTKQRLLRHFRISPHKITKIAHGLTTPLSGKGVTLSDYGVYAPYFLTVGNFYPHKNHAFVLNAFRAVADLFPHAALVLAGKKDHFSMSLEALARSYNFLPHQIKFIYSPSDEVLGALYHQSTALVHMAKLEGFGWPPLEALSCGKPVIASDGGSLPEILGNRAELVGSNDEQALVGAMLKLLTNAKQSPLTASLSRAHATEFSWHRAAEQTLEVYSHFGYKLL